MRIVSAGEAMVEIAGAVGNTGRIGFGGDVLNTAVHLARLGRRVSFLSALGGDPFSRDLRAAWAVEGVDTGLVLTDPTRNCGVYSIRTDAAGERSFAYWRADSAARQVFTLPGIAEALAEAEAADLLFFSLITLAILPDHGRKALIALAETVRARGGKVAFDGNYRARLWAGSAEARAWRDRAISACDIGLPTLEDETEMGGPVDPDLVAKHWEALGASEVVVKLGPLGCRCSDGAIVAPPAVLKPVDTSGAGDAFNAGYLHARLAGTSGRQAALDGHHLAGWVVGTAGAIPPPGSDAPYSVLRHGAAPG